MIEIVAVDIGGTNARFAIAEIQGGQVVRLDPEIKLGTSDHSSLRTAWEDFGSRIGRPLPRAAGIAFAAPVEGDLLKLTNNPWVLRPARLGEDLGIDDFVLVNDFGAVGHAVARLGDEHFIPIAGPDRPVSEEKVVSIVGPGTGLGVALLVRRGGRNHVVETEGGHVDFAPLDVIEDRMLDQLRKRYRRVSVERVASGMGLANIYEALAAIENRPVRIREDKALWKAALAGEDSLAVAAFDRFCLTLGAVAGDFALAHGASAVVIAGGLGRRLADHLPRSGFHDRFIAKGRFERRMEQVSVKLITYPEPGLFGAAAAYAEAHT